MHSEAKAKVLYYGSRKSGKLVRCYVKRELGVYRVELEIHSSLLRRYHVSGLDELVTVGSVLYPKHVWFADLDWSRLERHLVARAGVRVTASVAEVRRRATSVQRAARYLRSNGISNPHRFFMPLAVNKEVERALEQWANDWGKEAGWMNSK